MGVTWTKLAQDDVSVVAGPYQLIYTSLGRNITLVAGRRYAFIVYTCGTGDYNSQLFGLAPATTTFGYFTSLTPPTHAVRSDAWHDGTCDPTGLTMTTADADGFYEAQLPGAGGYLASIQRIESPGRQTTSGYIDQHLLTNRQHLSLVPHLGSLYGC